MAIQNESEEEKKRKLAAAKDYLTKRDAFRETQKPGYTVDMTGEDTSKMSDDQIKAEGNRRIAETKTNFQNSFSEARAAGFGSDPTNAAKEYLSRSIGWPGADPEKIPDKDRGVKFSVGPGAVADRATADRILSNREKQADAPTSKGPDWDKFNEARASRIEAAKIRDAQSLERSKAFFARLEDEKNQKRVVDQELALAKRNNYNARLVERAMRAGLQRYVATGGREGNLVTDDQMSSATARVADSEIGLGTGRNVDETYNFAKKRLEQDGRVNPWASVQRGSVGVQGTPTGSTKVQRDSVGVQGTPTGSTKDESGTAPTSQDQAPEPANTTTNLDINKLRRRNRFTIPYLNSFTV
jgi:hypothetical protein